MFNWSIAQLLKARLWFIRFSNLSESTDFLYEKYKKTREKFLTTWAEKHVRKTGSTKIEVVKALMHNTYEMCSTSSGDSPESKWLLDANGARTSLLELLNVAICMCQCRGFKGDSNILSEIVLAPLITTGTTLSSVKIKPSANHTKTIWKQDVRLCTR